MQSGSAQCAVGAAFHLVPGQSVVVVQAICHDRSTAASQNERTGLNGVHGAGVNLEKKSPHWISGVEHAVPAAIFDHLRCLGAVMLGALADVIVAPGSQSSTYPSTRFLPEAAVLVLGVLVVGVNLDRKVVMASRILTGSGNSLPSQLPKLTVLGPPTACVRLGGRAWGFGRLLGQS